MWSPQSLIVEVCWFFTHSETTRPLAKVFKLLALWSSYIYLQKKAPPRIDKTLRDFLVDCYLKQSRKIKSFKPHLKPPGVILEELSENALPNLSVVLNKKVKLKYLLHPLCVCLLNPRGHSMLPELFIVPPS